MRNAGGPRYAAAKGSPLAAGDTVTTGTSGRAQIRFADGGYVSLMPDTEFSIREYRYDGRLDGTETSFLGLTRGAMRAATGWIGRVNKSRYMIITPTATIGVRGTGGLIQVLGDGTTRLVGTSGIWTLTNDAGTLAVPAGTAGITLPDRTVPPRQAAQAPLIPPAAATVTAHWVDRSARQKDETYVAGNARNPAGTAPLGLVTPPLIPPPSLSGPGITPIPLGEGTYSFAYAYGHETNPAPGVTGSAGDAGFLASIAVRFASAEVIAASPFGRPSTEGDNRTREAGNNGLMAWGRWVGTVTDTTAGAARTIGPQEGLHYVFGTATPPSSLPGASSQAQAFVPYRLTAATSPTVSQGGVPAGSLTSAAMAVDFNSRRVGVEMTAQFSGFSVSMQTRGGTADPTQSGVSIIGSRLAGIFDQVAVSGARPATLCPSGCTGGLNGIFAGASGEQAGIAYQVVSTGTGTGRVSGVAIFAR